MKFLIVLATIIAVGSAAKKYAKPLEEHFKDFVNERDIHLIIDEDERPPTQFTGNVMQAKINSLNNIVSGKGKFNYNFETQNGINIASIGKLKDDKTFVVSGSYSYTGADGRKYRVRYTADEFGYHPVTELEENEPIQPIAPPTTPKPYVPNALIFNRNFVAAKPTQAPLNRLYLPVTEAPNRLYLPAKEPVAVPQPTYRPIPNNLPSPPPLPVLPPNPYQAYVQPAPVYPQSRDYLPPQNAYYQPHYPPYY